MKTVVVIEIGMRLQGEDIYHGQKRILHNDKRINLPRIHSNPNCLNSKQQRCKISKRKTDRTDSKNRQIYTYIVGDFNICLSTMDRTIREKISKDIEEFNIINQQSDQYLQNMPPNNSREHKTLMKKFKKIKIKGKTYFIHGLEESAQKRYQLSLN